MSNELLNSNPPSVVEKFESKKSLGYNVFFCIVSCPLKCPLKMGELIGCQLTSLQHTYIKCI